jgi:hypothetical protein
MTSLVGISGCGIENGSEMPAIVGITVGETLFGKNAFTPRYLVEKWPWLVRMAANIGIL